MNTDVSRMLEGGAALWLADGPAAVAGSYS